MTDTVLYRTFASTLQVRDVAGSGERLRVYGRVVPYGEVIEHDDHIPGGPLYRERFSRGALARVPNYVHRVKLGIKHESGYVGNVGRGETFEDRDDGAYMVFKLYRQDAEKAIDHLETTFQHLSVEFVNLHTRTAPDGVIERKLVRLERVAAVEQGAYAGAVVLGVRKPTTPQTPVEPTGPQEPADAENEAQETPQPAGRSNLDQALALRAQMRRDRPGAIGGAQ